MVRGSLLREIVIDDPNIRDPFGQKAAHYLRTALRHVDNEDIHTAAIVHKQFIYRIVTAFKRVYLQN